jgi:hypothetical protein
VHRRQTWSQLARRLDLRPDYPSELLAFDHVIGKLGQTGQRQLGLHEVDLDTIIGSVDRVGDFDRWFRPRPRVDRQRWIDLDRAGQAGASIPPIEVYRIGHLHFVSDGHHRVSIARAHGQRSIDAFVTEVTTTLPAVPGCLDEPEHETDRSSWSTHRWLRLGAHHYQPRERQIIVEKKDKIKAAIGHSPDFADSLLAAWWCRAYQPKSSFRVRRP